jgi:RecA-family ATPase
MTTEAAPSQSIDVDSPAYWASLGLDKRRCMLSPAEDASNLEWALHYAAIGFCVHPVCWPDENGNCACKRRKGPHVGKQVGKAPLINNWEKESTRDPAQIVRWWKRWPNASIGALDNERSGLFVVDNDKDSEEARQLRPWLASFTRLHQTSEPYKWHAFLKRPPGLVIRKMSTTVLGVNTESNGQVLLPPSLHKNGVRYSIVSDLPIADAPPRLIEWLQSLPLEKPEKNGRRPASTPLTQPERGSIMEDMLGALNECPPFDTYECAKLESALWYCDAAGVRVLDPCEPSFEAWSLVLYPLAWLVRNGWPWEWVFALFIDWCAEAAGLKDQQGRDVYPGSDECKRRLRHAVEKGEGVDNPRTLRTIYGLVHNRSWEPPTLEATLRPAPHWANGSLIMLGGQQESMPALADTLAGVRRDAPPEAPQEQGIEIIRGDALLSTAAPPRRWLVDKFIPDAEVTMLGGDGGTGKTTLALQLATGCVGCASWLGLKVKPCNVLYISAEDPRNDIHFRLEKITLAMPTARADLARLALVDLAGKDATIATFDKNSLIKPTPLLDAIEKVAREHEVGCIVLDSVADFFGGNENERREVRAFIGLLRGLAMRLSAAIVILAHPSVDGIKTGRGYSGSTHWNNAVRSRMYFTSAEKDDDGPPNPDARQLELVKSNRARSGEKIHLVWCDGRFNAVTAEVAGRPPNTDEAEELFLQLLSKLHKQNRHVSPHRSPSYAPTVMAKMLGSKGIGKAALERAMLQLLDQGKIRVTERGPPSRLTRHLEVCTDHDAIAGRVSTGSREPGLQPGAPSVATQGGMGGVNTHPSEGSMKGV